MSDLELVPDLKNWRDVNNSSFSIGDWIGVYATPELMVGFASIFWPEFIVVDGCIFLKDSYCKETFETWMESMNGDLEEVQGVMNHTHIYDLFQGEKGKTLNIQQVSYLSKILLSAWSAKIKQDFPDLSVEVQICDYDENDVENSIVGTSVAFWAKQE